MRRKKEKAIFPLNCSKCGSNEYMVFSIDNKLHTICKECGEVMGLPSKIVIKFNMQKDTDKPVRLPEKNYTAEGVR